MKERIYMASIISIALQKGGVGKSTTALALAGILGAGQKKFCLSTWTARAMLPILRESITRSILFLMFWGRTAGSLMH